TCPVSSPQAVCCGDHKHCCPQGYTCNVATESCEKLLAPTLLLPAPADPRGAPSPLRWAPPMPPTLLRAAGAHPGAPVPCGATHSCRGGQRCCRAWGGSWGCCPFAQVSGGTPGGGVSGRHRTLPSSPCVSPQGSCCSDGRHCCPAGSRCTGGGWGCSPQRWDLP
ncbi:GRN protein, partial [Piprites chloris]|nr:GRN protein [Piprites chloris]